MGKVLRGALILGALFINPYAGLVAFQSLGGAEIVGLGPKRPKAGPAQLGRLGPSVDPGTPRMMVLGNTAFPVALRYVEPSGTNQEYVDYIVCCAAHEVQSIDELWFEDRQAWTASGGVTGTYAGYLTVEAITEAGSGAYHTVNAGTNWGSAQRLTGCATLKIRIKRTGNSKKAESPLGGGLPSRVTIRGKGMPTYDPRQDSTNGGSGTQRPNDRTTWSYGASAPKQGENPALQILSYLLGWTINGRLSVGKGIPASRLDLDSFIDAANICDESVSLAAGGSHYRYQSHGVFSEADSPLAVLEALCAACNGTLRDANGKLRLDILHNDLATYVDLGDDDVLGAFTWDQTPSVEAFPNIIRGKFTDPSDNALYQMVDYPEVALSSIDGIDRIVTLDLPLVQDAARAQRIAKQALQRMQYPGVFRAEFNAKAWTVKVGSVVRLTFSALGFTNKLFRVVEQAISLNGVCAMTLREENSAIYAWSAEEATPITAAAATTYDRLNDPLIRQVQIFRQATDPALTQTVYDDALWTDTSVTPNVEKKRISGAWVTVANLVTQGTHIGVENAATKNKPERSIIRNSAFDDYDASNLPIGWRVSRGTLSVIVSAVSTRGTGCLLMSPNAVVESDPFSVTPGETIWIDYSFLTFNDRTSTAAPLWNVGIHYYADEATAFPSFDSFDYAVTSIAHAASESYVDGVVAVTVPANRKVARLVAYFDDGNAGSGALGIVDYLAPTRHQPAADVTVDQPVVSLLSPTTGRGISRRLAGQFAGSGVDRLISTNPLSASTDGGGVATITINAHDEIDDAGTLSFTSSSIGGLAASTTYYVYEDNANYTAGARSYVATTTRANLAAAGRRYVGTVTTPAAGGSSSGTGGTGGGWGGGGGDIP